MKLLDQYGNSALLKSPKTVRFLDELLAFFIALIKLCTFSGDQGKMCYPLDTFDCELQQCIYLYINKYISLYINNINTYIKYV